MDRVINTIIYTNMIPLLALFTLLVMVKVNHLFDNKQSRLFCSSIYVVIVMLFIISLGAIFERSGYTYAWIIRKSATFINFIASPLIPLFIYKIYAKGKTNKLVYILFGFNIIICFFSLFFGIVFNVTSGNAYSRGPLFFVPFLTSAFYILLLIVNAGSGRNKGKTSERILLVWIVLLQILCMSLEIVMGFRFLTWDAAAISLIVYYLLININNFKYDTLTGIYNRAMYNKKLTTIENSISCVIALIDINDFKQINDLKGHAEGDKCLINFAQLLQKYLEKGMLLYRIGGDEFAILSTEKSESEIEVFLEKILVKTNEIQIDFAYGISLYKPDENLDAALHTADQKMYIHKNKNKEQR